MLRKTIFWIHLILGVTASAVILMMSVTGVLLTFQTQITAFDNRSYSTVEPPSSGSQPLDLETIIVNVEASEPEANVTAVTIRPDPTDAYVVWLGRKSVFVNPYNGEVRGEGNTGIRDFFREIMYWHRWFAAEGDNRAIGKALTGAGNLVFCLLIVTGFYIWWPKKWTWPAFKNILKPNFNLRSKKMNFNWHNTLGFWFLPILFLIALSGLVISYSWAGDLIYALASSERPQRSRSLDKYETTAEKHAGRLDDFVAAAQRQVPDWAYIKLNIPKPGAKTTILEISEMDNRVPITRSTLTVSTKNGDAMNWVPFFEQNTGSQIQTWIRWIHTGEAGGWFGQLIAGIASAAGVLLVWTGIALAWQRFRRYMALTKREF